MVEKIQSRNVSQIELTEEALVSHGIPREKIVKLPELVNSTMSEALLTRRYARERGLKQIIVVTSDYHTRRALWAFEKAFAGDPVQLMVSPAISSTAGANTYLIEIAKFLYYLVKYGLMGI